MIDGGSTLIWKGGVCLVLFILVSFAWGDVDESSGTMAMTFLKIGIGAEAIGMGESVTALTGDLYAAYWNPAGLSYVQQSQIGFMHGEWFEGIKHEFAGFAHPIGQVGGFAVTVNYLSYGQIDRRDTQGNLMGTFRPYDLALSLSAGIRISDTLFMGVTGKSVNEEIDQSSAHAFGIDMGVIYDLPGSPMSLGVTAHNLGSKVRFSQEEFSMPVILSGGIAYRLAGGNMAFSTDLRKPLDDSPSIGFGIGIKTLKLLSLRAGYRYEIGGNDLGALSGLRIGLGFGIENYQIDYAFASYGELGPTHRFSLLAKF